MNKIIKVAGICLVIFCLIIVGDMIFLLINYQFPIKSLIARNIFLIINILGLVCLVIGFLGFKYYKFKYYKKPKVKS